MDTPLEGHQGPPTGTTAISKLDKAASKGILHKRNAARRKSRLMKKLNTMAVAS